MVITLSYHNKEYFPQYAIANLFDNSYPVSPWRFIKLTCRDFHSPPSQTGLPSQFTFIVVCDAVTAADWTTDQLAGRRADTACLPVTINMALLSRTTAQSDTRIVTCWKGKSPILVNKQIKICQPGKRSNMAISYIMPPSEVLIISGSYMQNTPKHHTLSYFYVYLLGMVKVSIEY